MVRFQLKHSWPRRIVSNDRNVFTYRFFDALLETFSQLRVLSGRVFKEYIAKSNLRRIMHSPFVKNFWNPTNPNDGRIHRKLHEDGFVSLRVFSGSLSRLSSQD